MKPEDKAKQGVKALLKKYNVWFFKPQMGGFGKAGIPDFICCIRGRLLGVETKAVGKKPTPLQQKEIDGINAAGGVAVVVTEDRLQAFELLLLTMLRSPELGTTVLEKRP